MSAIATGRYAMQDSDHTRHWPALLLAIGGVLLTFWRGVTGMMALATTVLKRLKTLEDEVKSLRTKDNEQQAEIDGLKAQLEAVKARKKQLESELAAANETIIAKELQIAALERERNAAMLHADSLINRAKIDQIAQQLPDVMPGDTEL